MKDSPPNLSPLKPQGWEPTVESASPTGWRVWLDALGTHRKALLAVLGVVLVAGFALAALALFLFAYLADEVMDQETLKLDMAVLEGLRALHTPTLDAVAVALSFMGSEFLVGLCVVLVAVWIWQRRWGAAVALVLVLVGAEILNNILKDYFRRPRPTDVTALLPAQVYSFPSGHAMVSAAVYLFLAYVCWRELHGRWRYICAAGLIALVFLIGLSRLYLGVHYFTDVMAGYVAGFFWADTVIVGGRVLALWRHPDTGQPAPKQAQQEAA